MIPKVIAFPRSRIGNHEILIVYLSVADIICMVHAHIEPVISTVHKHVIPFMDRFCAVCIKKISVDYTAVKAQVTQKHSQQRCKVQAVAVVTHHYVISISRRYRSAVIKRHKTKMRFKILPHYSRARFDLSRGFIDIRLCLGGNGVFIKMVCSVPLVFIARTVFYYPVINSTYLLTF